MEDRLAPVLRALPYALRGTSTSALPFNSLGQLVLPADLPSSLATALVPLTEPCVLFRALDLTLQRVSPHGLLQQALFSGIREKLRSYLVLVSDIETSMLIDEAPSRDRSEVQTEAVASRDGAAGTLDVPSSSGSPRNEGLKTRRGLASMQALLQSPTLYLRLFLTVVQDSLDPSRNTLNILYAYAQHGDPLIARYASELHFQCYEPFKRLMRDWEDFGTLGRDVYGEFFVERSPESKVSRRGSSSSRPGSLHGSIHNSVHGSVDSETGRDQNIIDLGHTPFRLVEDRVPLPMTVAEARQSFERGAALYFIRDVCGDVEFDGASRTPAEISKRTRSLLFVDHELPLHLQGLRDYMLLANGNFVDALFRNDSTNFLMQPVSSVGSYLASEFFVSAIDDLRGLESKTVTKCVDAYILGLEAKPNSEDAKDSKSRWRVWEAFIGKYHLDSRPLQLIVDKRAIKAYERCFASLWRVRLAVYSLSEASGTLRWLARRRDVAQLVDAHAVMNARMLEIQQLLYYGVIDHEWTQFERELEGRSSPTAIKSAHDAFISRVVEAVASPYRTKTIQGLARVVLGLQRVLEDAGMEDEVSAGEESFVAELVASFVALAGSLGSPL